MKWFAVYLVANYLWGNAALETRPPQLSYFFYGTLEQCMQQATQAGKKGETERPNFGAIKHAKLPREFNGGIVKITHLGGTCLLFESDAEIRDAFPLDERGLGWLAVDKKGNFVPCWNRYDHANSTVKRRRPPVCEDVPKGEYKRPENGGPAWIEVKSDNPRP